MNDNIVKFPTKQGAAQSPMEQFEKRAEVLIRRAIDALREQGVVVDADDDRQMMRIDFMSQAIGAVLCHEMGVPHPLNKFVDLIGGRDDNGLVTYNWKALGIE